jgi:Arm domain-containing DNA-binding protein
MLTDTAIRNAKPRERPYKLSDSRGLYLLVTPQRGEVGALRLPLRRQA